MATPTETADKVRRAEDGDNNGDAGAQGTPALAVDTIQDGLIDVPVQLPAGGQEANILATPDQPRQAPLVQLFGGGAYQPAVYMATPVPTGGGPPTDVGASNATAPPAPTLPAVPQLRLPATGAITVLAGARSATGTEQSPQKVFVRVVQEPNGTMAPPAAPLPAVPQRIMPISDAIGATDGTPAPLHRDSRRSRSTVTLRCCRGGSGKPAARHGQMGIATSCGGALAASRC